MIIWLSAYTFSTHESTFEIMPTSPLLGVAYLGLIAWNLRPLPSDADVII